MKAKSIAISLLLVWVFQILFALVYFNLAKQNCYSQFRKNKQTIDKRLILSFFIKHKETIEWEKDGKEFIINGQYYDVVKLNQTDSGIYIQCISDDTESALKANLLDNLLNKNQTNKKVKLQVDKYVFEIKKQLILSKINKIVFSDFYVNNHINFNLEINVPPPKFGV